VAAAEVDKVHLEIQRLEDLRYQAMISADIKVLDGLLDDQMTYSHSSGVVDDKASYLKGISERVWDYRSVARSGFTDLRPSITIAGNTALVFAKLDIESVNSGIEAKFTTRTLAVWIRREQGWRFLALHSGGVPKVESKQKDN
jgi:ketosteroid isomerase-like protein